jgi:hypothetical protein
MSAGRIPAALRTHLGDDATFGLIEVLNSEEKDWREHVLTAAADRFERRLMEETSLSRGDLHQALHDGLTAIRHELATTRVELLKWSFLFWVGQLAAVAGLLAVMFRLAGR